MIKKLNKLGTINNIDIFFCQWLHCGDMIIQSNNNLYYNPIFLTTSEDEINFKSEVIQSIIGGSRNIEYYNDLILALI